MAPAWITGFAFTFIGVGIGGLIAFLMNGSPGRTGTIYGVCTGAILGMIGFDILPDVLRSGGAPTVSAGFLAGVILFWFIHQIGFLQTHPSRLTKVRPGLLLIIAFAVHNFPIGLMMGTGGPADLDSSLVKTLVLHNVPEGMILFMPLFAGGMTIVRMFAISLLIAFPVATGAAAGEILGLQSDRLSAFLISLSVGMIYRIAVKEILPEAVRHSSNLYSLFVAVVSFLLMGLYLLLL